MQSQNTRVTQVSNWRITQVGLMSGLKLNRLTKGIQTEAGNVN